jgi:stage II sporulation protein D
LLFLFLTACPAYAVTVRVGVLGLFRPSEVSVIPASLDRLRVEGDSRQLILEGSRNARLRVAGRLVEVTSEGDTLAASTIRVTNWQGNPTEFVLSLPGKISRLYHGTLEVSASDDKLILAVAMDLELAVASAVAAESPPGAPLEALKVQAIVARSYYLAAPRRHHGFDFCDTTHCQFLREAPASGAPAAAATLATAGLVVTYHGEVLAALYSASCGGRTRTPDELGLPAQGYPYYPVSCAYCLRRAPRWDTILDVEEASSLLDGQPTEAQRLQIGRKLGWSALPGNNFAFRQEGGTVIIQGRGKGHGIGLCQWGATGMAAQGASFREILNYYFSNTSLGSSPDSN